MRSKDSPREEEMLSRQMGQSATGKPPKKMDLLPSSKAFMRTKSLETSAWYMASFTTYLVEKKDTNGDFSLMESLLVPGNEPPPHVHSREDELYYVLDGEFDVYVGGEAFKVKTGACVFLPRLKPHGFVIRSPRLRLLLIITPGGLEEAFRTVASPARDLELPVGMPTYSSTDLKQTAQRLSQYGVRLLTPAEIAAQLPLYPKPLSSEPRGTASVGRDQ